MLCTCLTANGRPHLLGLSVAVAAYTVLASTLCYKSMQSASHSCCCTCFCLPVLQEVQELNLDAGQAAQTPAPAQEVSYMSGQGAMHTSVWVLALCCCFDAPASMDCMTEALEKASRAELRCIGSPSW
jgi:hypothetical protein